MFASSSIISISNFQTISIYYVILKGLLIDATSILRKSVPFTDTSIWLNDHVPCENDKVVFPYDYSGLLILPPKVDVAGFILPKNGAMLLSLDGIINLNSNEEKNQKCRESNREGRRAQLLPPKIYKWFDPRTWLKTPDSSFPINKATPTLELLPCSNETILIPANGFFTFDLQRVNSISLGHLNLADSSLSKDYLQQLLTNSDLGAAIFKNRALGTTVKYYAKETCGCLRNFNEYLEPVCRKLISECQITLCEVPIQPLGNCCPICGASMRFEMDSCNLTRKQIFEDYLQTHLNQRTYKDLDLHVDYFHSDKLGIFLQAIIIDRNDYEEKSVNFLKSLNETTNWRKLLNIEKNSDQFNLDFHVSGKSHSPVTVLHVFFIILSLIIGSGVILVMYYHFSGSVYSHRDLFVQYLQSLGENFRYYWRQITAPANYAFARFDNARESIQTNFRATTTATETLVASFSDRRTGKHQSSSLQQMPEDKRSFNNPMFSLVSSEITNDDNEKSQTEGEGSKNASTPIALTATQDKQEMVEIHLEKLTLDNNETVSSETNLN